MRVAETDLAPRTTDNGRKSRHYRLRTGRLDGRDLCRPGQPEPASVRGRPDLRKEPHPGNGPAGPTEPDDRGGELSELAGRRRRSISGQRHPGEPPGPDAAPLAA